MKTINRGAKKADFKAYFGSARRFSSPNITLSVAKKEDPESPSAWAFVVGAKQIPLATGRNLLKRRSRAIMCELSVAVRSGLLLFFNFKKSVTTLSYSALKIEMADLVKKAGILNNV